MKQNWVNTVLPYIRSLLEDHPPNQAAEDLGDVGVVSSRLGDGDAQLGIAHGAQGADPSAQHPHDEGQAHGARVLQDPLRRDEDPRADDVSWGEQGERTRFSMNVCVRASVCVCVCVGVCNNNNNIV